MNVTLAYRRQLEAIVSDRNAPQKHVWRAKIILATADGCGLTDTHTSRQRKHETIMAISQKPARLHYATTWTLPLPAAGKFGVANPSIYKSKVH